MEPLDFQGQVKTNLLTIISLIMAITALIYGTWRNEVTEHNRNIRTAGFALLQQLEDLQASVNDLYYQADRKAATARNPIMAWGHVAVIGDLAKLLPQPVPQVVDKLVAEWRQNVQTLATDEAASDKVSQDIDDARQAVLNVLTNLR